MWKCAYCETENDVDNQLKCVVCNRPKVEKKPITIEYRETKRSDPSLFSSARLDSLDEEELPIEEGKNIGCGLVLSFLAALLLVYFFSIGR